MTKGTTPETLNDADLDATRGAAKIADGNGTVVGHTSDESASSAQGLAHSSRYLDGSDVGLSVNDRRNADFGDHVGNYN